MGQRQLMIECDTIKFLLVFSAGLILLFAYFATHIYVQLTRGCSKEVLSVDIESSFGIQIFVLQLQPLHPKVAICFNFQGVHSYVHTWIIIIEK